MGSTQSLRTPNGGGGEFTDRLDDRGQVECGNLDLDRLAVKGRDRFAQTDGIVSSNGHLGIEKGYWEIANRPQFHVCIQRMSFRRMPRVMFFRASFFLKKKARDKNRTCSTCPVLKKLTTASFLVKNCNVLAVTPLL